jgi:hypothetical protein
MDLQRQNLSHLKAPNRAKTHNTPWQQINIIFIVLGIAKMDTPMIFATGGYDEKVVLWDVVNEYTKR